ncbi:MAG TPA: hypothetical protein VKW76_06495 [Candidatus Binatia bacterium]|nr:hypothetical protein [Candidatus Binatia bacterium]
MGTRLTTMLGALAALALVLPSCRLVPGKPFTSRLAIETEFDIPADEDFAFGAYRFNEDFQLPPGTMGAKITTLVPASTIGSVPQSLRWTATWYDPTFTTVLGTYAMTANRKMTRIGHDYRIVYDFKPSVFPGYRLSQNDSVQMSIRPIGGKISTGWNLGLSFGYRPTGSLPPETTTTTIPLRRVLTVDAAFASESGGQFTTGQTLCLSQITGGCVAAPGQCPAVHLHSAAGPSGTITVAVGGTTAGPYVDPESSGMHCGYGDVGTATACGPDTLPACP